jgi:DNA-binding MarR family transcriptional regulator
MTAEEEPVPSTASRLQEELKQKRPFRSTEQQAFLGLLRTGDACKARFTAIFEPEGVTFQQYNVLRILRGAGPDGLPTLEIGERMIERTPGVTRIVDRLERKGWVVRVRGKDDRRQVWCRITPTGLDLLSRLDEPVGEADRAVFAGLDREELEELLRLLDTVRQHLTETA